MNVVIIITDQQRYDAIGYRNQHISTPHLDNLQRQSVDCQATYAQSPQCQPSRASLFTGRHPTAHRVWWNSIQLPRSERTLANYLKDAGFQTAYVGKLHFSEKRDESQLASHFGFDTTFLTHDWQKYCTNSGQANVVKSYYDILRTEKWYGQLANREWQHDEVITEKALEFIKKTPHPFFLVASYNGPHPPYAAPSPFSEWYSQTQFISPANCSTYDGVALSVEDWQHIKSQYYGCVSWLDENIGRILSVLDDDTIVVFTSDHGDILGEHGWFSKGPFTYEGNTRVPLLMRLPGVQPLAYQGLVQHIDILPTILHRLALPIPPCVHGRSLLHGFWENREINRYALSMIGHSPRLRMIRYKQFKYWLYGQEERCFNLQIDPQEEHNIRDEATLCEMRYLLLRALIEAEDPVPRPAWSGAPPINRRDQVES